MDDERRKGRQLDAALRLRALQREKAELKHGQTQRALVEAERLFGEQHKQYQGILARLEQQVRAGVVLDSFLHEQRLLAQRVAYLALEQQDRFLGEARRTCAEAKQALLLCRLDEDIARKANARINETLQQFALTRESIDIFDAQQAQGAEYGI